MEANVTDLLTGDTGVIGVWISMDDGPWEALSLEGGVYVTAPQKYYAGTYYWRLKAEDNAGNVAYSNLYTLTVSSRVLVATYHMSGQGTKLEDALPYVRAEGGYQHESWRRWVLYWEGWWNSGVAFWEAPSWEAWLDYWYGGSYAWIEYWSASWSAWVGHWDVAWWYWELFWAAPNTGNLGRWWYFYWS